MHDLNIFMSYICLTQCTQIKINCIPMLPSNIVQYMIHALK